MNSSVIEKAHLLSPDAAQEADWWRLYRQTGDMTAREAIMRLHLPYARTVAATYYARRTHDDVGFEDYLQLASMGMIESVDRYDPTRGAQFRTFAARRMHGAILNGLEKCTEKSQQIAVRKRVRQERLDSLKESAQAQTASRQSKHSDDELFSYLGEVGIGIALGILLEGTGMIDADAYGSTMSVAAAEVSYFRQSEMLRLQALVHGLLDQLDQQEQIVIRRHYLQEIPFEEIARQLGLSKGRISQVHSSALRRLRGAIADSGNLDVTL